MKPKKSEEGFSGSEGTSSPMSTYLLTCSSLWKHYAVKVLCQNKQNYRGFVIFRNHIITCLIHLQLRIYQRRSLHTSAIHINDKSRLFLMPHCNCSLHASHQEKLKWVLKERREDVWGVRQKHPGPDLPNTMDRRE